MNLEDLHGRELLAECRRLLAERLAYVHVPVTPEPHPGLQLLRKGDDGTRVPLSEISS